MNDAVRRFVCMGDAVYGRRVISLMKPAFFGWGFADRIAMLLPSRVAGRTVGLRGPDLARGPEVACPWPKHCLQMTFSVSSQ